MENQLTVSILCILRLLESCFIRTLKFKPAARVLTLICLGVNSGKLNGRHSINCIRLGLLTYRPFIAVFLVRASCSLMVIQWNLGVLISLPLSAYLTSASRLS
jgi:hypothetical protein